MDRPHLLSMQGVDRWEHGFRPLQPPAESMVDSKAIPSGPIIIAFRPLLLDLVESGAPLRIRVLELVNSGYTKRHSSERYLEGCRSPLGDVAHNDFRVVVLEDAQQTSQIGVSPRLPREAESVVVAR